jgi:hypothetical protein
MTMLRPQPPLADSVFGGAFAPDCAITVLGRMMDLANPAPKVAMQPTNERLPLEGSVNWFFDFFGMSGLLSNLSIASSSFEKETANSAQKVPSDDLLMALRNVTKEAWQPSFAAVSSAVHKILSCMAQVVPDRHGW